MKTSLAAALAALALFSTNVLADADGSYVGYDEIVNELKNTIKEESEPKPPPEDDQDTAMHGGLALTTSWVSLNTPNGAGSAGLLKGAEFSIGMNLFSKNYRAEGAFSNYSQANLNSTNKADLREFEARLVYLSALEDVTNLRLGTGISARSMDIDSYANGRWSSYQSSTPNWIFMAGFERKVLPNFTIGPDLSLRTAMVGDAYEKTAWDASFRLNATF